MSFDVAVFRVNDSVRIVPFEGAKGVVNGVYFNRGPVKYDIRFFMDGKINSEYFYENELEKIN